MNTATLSIPTPESCSKCELWWYCMHERKLTIYTDIRNPDCPLTIESEGLKRKAG